MDDPVRVKDKSTGHEYTIERRSVDPEAHTVTQKKAVDDGGTPLPAVHNPDLGKTENQPETSEAQK